MPSYSPEIRFSDIDAMGHVNNAVYLSYFEQARIFYFKHILDQDWDWFKHGILVARNEINYAAPIFQKDKIEIITKCTHIGTKSFTITYEVMRGSEVCSTGASVLVCFDYHQKTTIAIPDDMRKKLESLKV
jgi:acyl-CoA thioester hydrolase